MNFLHKLISAAFPELTPEVDLHGLRVPEALEATEKAIAAAKKGGAASLRIICGKGKGSPGGRGVLREAVAGWLEAHGFEGRFRRVIDADGLDGSIIVDLGESQEAGK